MKNFQELVLQELKELKKEIQETRWLLESEIYGCNGREGLKQRISVLWAERENTQKLKLAVWGAVFSAVASLAVTLIKMIL